MYIVIPTNRMQLNLCMNETVHNFVKILFNFSFDGILKSIRHPIKYSRYYHIV